MVMKPHTHLRTERKTVEINTTEYENLHIYYYGLKSNFCLWILTNLLRTKISKTWGCDVALMYTDSKKRAAMNILVLNAIRPQKTHQQESPWFACSCTSAWHHRSGVDRGGGAKRWREQMELSSGTTKYHILKLTFNGKTLHFCLKHACTRISFRKAHPLLSDGSVNATFSAQAKRQVKV